MNTENETEEVVIDTQEAAPIKPGEVTIDLGEVLTSDSLEEFGGIDSVREQLKEYQELKAKSEGIPFEKLEFLKRDGDPIENLKKYQEVFETDYTKKDDSELIISHLLEQGKTQKQAEKIFNTFSIIGLDPDYDDDFEEREAELIKAKEEAVSFFSKKQEQMREEYNNSLSLGNPKSVIEFADSVKTTDILLKADVVSYKVPQLYVEEAAELLKTVPMRNVSPEKYQETIEGILWLNPAIRQDLIQQALKATLSQVQAKHQEEIKKLKEEHKASLLQNAGVQRNTGGNAQPIKEQSNGVFNRETRVEVGL